MARAGYQKRRELERAIERDKEFLSTAGWSLKKTTEHYSDAAGFPYGTGTVRDVLVDLDLYSVKPKGKVEPAAEDEPGLYVTAASFSALSKRFGRMEGRHSALSIETTRVHAGLLRRLDEISLRVSEIESRQNGMQIAVSEWSETFGEMVRELSAAKTQLAEVLESMTVPAAE